MKPEILALRDWALDIEARTDVCIPREIEVKINRQITKGNIKLLRFEVEAWEFLANGKVKEAANASNVPGGGAVRKRGKGRGGRSLR